MTRREKLERRLATALEVLARAEKRHVRAFGKWRNARADVNRLEDRCRQTYGGLRPDYPNIVAWAGRMALEVIAESDALYHNAEHTILVTLVGQEMLRILAQRGVGSKRVKALASERS